MVELGPVKVNDVNGVVKRLFPATNAPTLKLPICILKGVVILPVENCMAFIFKPAFAVIKPEQVSAPSDVSPVVPRVPAIVALPYIVVVPVIVKFPDTV